MFLYGWSVLALRFWLFVLCFYPMGSYVLRLERKLNFEEVWLEMCLLKSIKIWFGAVYKPPDADALVFTLIASTKFWITLWASTPGRYKPDYFSPISARKILSEWQKYSIWRKMATRIDPIKDNSAILAWVQNYWDEHAAKAYFSMADQSSISYSQCQIMHAVHLGFVITTTDTLIYLLLDLM